MNPFEAYDTALWGILVILGTLLLQLLIASVTKAKQPGAIPGKMDPDLGHASFVFRSNRTFMNSVENAPAMLGTALLAVLVGASTTWTAALVWTYALARIAHMILYYAIATDVNPSPRSYFFLLGFAANIALLGFVAVALA
jgi:uncharacterized MAPEG superfamily protein